MHNHEHTNLQTAGRVIHWARLYDASAWLLKPVRKMTIEMAGLRVGDKVLDIGCGTGDLTIAAKLQAGPTGEVYGIDAAPEMIEVARYKAARKKVDITFKDGLIENIPFPDNMFDMVLSSLMMHHLPDELKEKGIAEIYRVLKPGGRFFCIDLNPPDTLMFRILFTIVPSHNMEQLNLGKCVPIMEKVNFKAIEMGRTKYRMLAFVRGQRR